MTEVIEDRAWMEQLLRDEEVCHLGMTDAIRPYVLPINYAYLDGKIVLHCAMTGRKLDLIRANPSVCVVVDRHPDQVKYHAEKRCHYRFQSVIVGGRAEFIESADERLEWIRRYRAYFNERHPWVIPPADDIASALRCGIVVIEIESMTARREEGVDSRAHEAIDK